MLTSSLIDAYCITEIILAGSGFQYVGCLGPDGLLSMILNYHFNSVADCLSQCESSAAMLNEVREADL